MIFLILLSVLVSPFATAAERAPSPRLIEVLRRGLFQEQGPIPALPADLQMEYQSMVFTMVASLRSEEPSRAGTWETIEMPSLGIPESCDGSIAAHVRRSRSGSPLTFVLLPGSHASFRRGGYTNQMVSILETQLGDPNLIALSGFQSPEFLNGRCHSILWNTTALGKDLHDRIGVLLGDLGLAGDKTGVVGFSGGASFVILAMAEDGPAAKHGKPVVFGLGGMAFSPILHGRTTFALLDSRHQLSSVEKTEGLLTYTWRTATRSLWHLLLEGWKAFYPMYQRRPQEFVDRGYNEMTVGFLSKAMAASGVPSDELGDDLSYYKGYVELGLQKSRGVPDANRDEEFDRATDVRPALAAIARPLLIYMAKDDPILSTYEGTSQPAVVTKILNGAQKNPAIRVFNPLYGGHTGAILDPVFPELVRSFFER